ncbi:MAG: restriction endonuclease [Desulfamplus sp.]|nr:restriction endonuclease [Desulfamplus sp.]
MDIKGWLEKLRSSSNRKEKYKFESDFEGLNFFTTPGTSDRITNGKAENWITHQHIALSILVEQGDAEVIPNGFIVPTEVAVQLDEDTRTLLELPPQWQGQIKADVRGESRSSAFEVNLSVETANGSFTRLFNIIGPILRLTERQQFMLTSAQQLIFGAHQAHSDSDKTEFDNLKLLLALQKGQSFGVNIDLSHFDKLDVKAPDSISIEVELDAQGNLILTPFMGQNASHEKISRVLGQLYSKKATALRVDDEIVLFDEQKLKAIHEILKNRIVPRSKVKEFLDKPTAFIDASLVDLDLGFSLRVKGATAFKHAYFGETDGSGIDWFGHSASSGTVFSISKIVDTIEDQATLDDLKNDIENARKTGAQELDFLGNTYDISSSEMTADTLEKIEKKIQSGVTTDEPDESDDLCHGEIPEPKKGAEITVLDIKLNDEDLDIASSTVDKVIADILYPLDRLTWENYARKPFPHQEVGVQWIVGLANQGEGGLLADDMGLGKTFMALSAIDQLYKLNSDSGVTRKPALIVAPLSLLETWKDEVGKTFIDSPFKSIVILQANADLNFYRTGGVEIRNQDVMEEGEAEIKYSLNVGKQFGPDRLDLDERLVITTYQTLRDYQFSLCLIDWGVVVFDEAQNIKNPNALQTRAAKGLKADFKLVATGTPVENSLKDFWCLMDTVCPGHLSHYQSFRETYVMPILRAAGDEIEEVRARIGRELRLNVGPLMLRRLKEDNLEGLPQKTIYVGIEGDTWSFLESLKATMSGFQLNSYNAALGIQVEAESNQVLGCLQRLRDLSLHPRLGDRGHLDTPDQRKELVKLFDESAKMQSLIHTLEQIKQRGEKCIIFSANKRLQSFLSLALGKWFKLGPLSIINGDAKAIAKQASVPTRKSMIADFEARNGFNIIIMSPIAAGVGLTVVGANNVVHFERHWNPAKEAQATDRVYRIGQEQDVNIYIPILHHPDLESFDANLHRLLSRKTSLKDAVVTSEQVVPNPPGFGAGVFTLDHRITYDDLLKISWEQFEALCGLLMAQRLEADSCRLTRAGADYGADVVVTIGQSGYLIQCKHTKNANYDGYKAIQEVQSARIKYENSMGVTFSNLIFMTNAKKLSTKTQLMAKEYGVSIISHDELCRLLDIHYVSFEQILTFLKKKRFNAD